MKIKWLLLCSLFTQTVGATEVEVEVDSEVEVGVEAELTRKCESQKTWRQGTEAFAQQRYSEALALANDCLKSCPKFWKTLPDRELRPYLYCKKWDSLVSMIEKKFMGPLDTTRDQLNNRGAAPDLLVTKSYWATKVGRIENNAMDRFLGDEYDEYWQYGNCSWGCEKFWVKDGVVVTYDMSFSGDLDRPHEWPRIRDYGFMLKEIFKMKYEKIGCKEQGIESWRCRDDLKVLVWNIGSIEWRITISTESAITNKLPDQKLLQIVVKRVIFVTN